MKLSGCFHQHSERVTRQGFVCQSSCFCPDMNMNYINIPHLVIIYWIIIIITCCKG